MKQRISTLIISLIAICPVINAGPEQVIIHSGGNNHGNNQIYIENPRVTYDDALNELYVYFGSSGTIDLECDDGTGTPYYYVYSEYHPACDTATYSNLPPGYYTITIHSVYGITYTGNFTVN